MMDRHKTTNPAYRKRKRAWQRRYRNSLRGRVRTALMQSRIQAEKHGGKGCEASFELAYLSATLDCDICGKSAEHISEMCLDHDHKTGTLRGWLCRKCNSALGMVGDSQYTLRAAATYLERAYWR